LPINLDRLAAALCTGKGRCRWYPDLSGVYAAETDRQRADWIDYLASAAKWDFLEVSGITRLTSSIESLPCRRVHFAAFVVRQAPGIGTDLVGVARLIAIGRVERDGNLLVGTRADLSDLIGTALERRVERSRLWVNSLRRCRGDRGHAQRRREHDASGDAGCTEQPAAGQGGMGRQRRRSRVGFR
jgi:hypothetical protein